MKSLPIVPSQPEESSSTEMDYTVILDLEDTRPVNDQVKPVDIQSVNPSMISEPVESKVKEDRQATDMSCCPQSQMNSHSDAECPAALPLAD